MPCERLRLPKFTVDDSHARFLNQRKAYGFKDKSAMLGKANDHFKAEMELERLKQSAELHAEAY